MAYLGSREILPDSWPGTGERKGVFVNLFSSSVPTLRPDGSALQKGDMYFGTDDLLYVRSSSATWVASSAGSSTLNAAYSGGTTISRTGDPITINDALTDATNTLVLNKTGAGSGNVLDLNASAAMTGDFLNITCTNAAVDAQALVIVGQAAVRTTNPLVDIQETGTGALATARITASAATTGPLLSLTATAAVAPVAGTNGMQTIDLTNSAVTAEGLLLIGPAAGRTGGMLAMTDAGTSTGPMLRLVSTSTSSANQIQYTTTGAITGDVVNITMTNAGNGADGIVLGGTNTARTGDFLRIVDEATTGTGQSIEIQSTAAKQGTHLLLNVDAAATGAVVHCDIDGAATGPIFDVDLDSTGSSVVFDIDIATGVWTGNIFTFNTTQAYAQDIFNLNMANMAAGGQALVIAGSSTTRTAHMIEITEAGTPSGDTINISHGGATTGDAIHINQANAVGGRALNLDGSGTRTVNLIDIDTTGADTAATVAIDVAGAATRGAIAITTTAVGQAATNEPAGILVSGSGDLAASSDLVRFVSSGNISATSNILAIEQNTGAGSAGAFGLYISCTGTNVEAIKVDDGTVTIDETLTVTGGITGAIRGTTGQTVAGGGTTTALTLAAFWHNIDADVGGDTFTLADGAEGQIKIISCLSATGVCTITPTNLAGGTSVTLNAAGETVILGFIGTEWNILGGNAYTVV